MHRCMQYNTHRTRNILIDVTERRVPFTSVAVEKQQKLHILRVCL
jgi:hypothetical protein